VLAARMEGREADALDGRGRWGFRPRLADLPFLRERAAFRSLEFPPLLGIYLPSLVSLKNDP
jgi:hypothetical protein